MYQTVKEVRNFGVSEQYFRKYIVINEKYGVLKKIVSSEKFNALTGCGEQREVVGSHVKKIISEIENGDFTPTAVSCGLRDEQRGTLTFDGNKVSLRLEDGQTIPLLDGGHRLEALRLLSELDKYKERVDNCDITCLIYLDGNTKKDFLNLQLGRPVDRSHLHSLTIQEKLSKSKDSKALFLAYETTKLLNSNEKSPFYNQVRFDSLGAAGLPVSSLNGKGASDIACSLVGGARIALKFNKDAKWLSDCVVTAFTYVKAQCPELMNPGMPLCPPPNGTKGAATMLVALGNMLAYRVCLKNSNSPDNSDIEALVLAAKTTFNQAINKNFSGPVKRALIGTFSSKMFAKMLDEKEYWNTIPLGLIELMSVSTFAVPKLEKVKEEKVPSEPKKKGKKKADAPATEEHQTEVKQDLFNESNNSETAPWDEVQG